MASRPSPLLPAAPRLTPQELVVDTYVVEAPAAATNGSRGEHTSSGSGSGGSSGITDMVSFYTLPSSVLGHPEHKEIRAAYMFYTGAAVCASGCGTAQLRYWAAGGGAGGCAQSRHALLRTPPLPVEPRGRGGALRAQGRWPPAGVPHACPLPATPHARMQCLAARRWHS